MNSITKKANMEIADLTINDYLILTDVFKVKLKEYFEQMKEDGVDYKQYEHLLIVRMSIELLYYFKSLQHNFYKMGELEGNQCDCYRYGYEGWFSTMYEEVFESTEFDKDFLDEFCDGECSPYEAFYYECDREVLWDFESYIINLYKMYVGAYWSNSLAKTLNIKAVINEVA